MPAPMPILTLAAAGAALWMSAASARAAELVMIEEEWCEWCQLWNEEIGVVYHKTKEGKRAPLRRVDIHGAEVDALNLRMRAHYTPTFVLMENGVEVGRIEGYPGEHFFWGVLGKLLEKLPEASRDKPPDADEATQ